MSEAKSDPGETGFDQVLRFTIPDRDARGRVVRVRPVLNTILAAHAYPSAVKRLLAEALVITALIGSLLKDDEGQLTMQAQTDGGVIELLVCDYRAGELRGHVRFDHSKLDDLGPNPTLFALFADGFLAITFDLAGTGQRYQGIVPLDGESLAQACAHYFFQSEQVPTLLRVAVGNEGENWTAGGLLVQHLPEGEEGRERLHAQLDHPEWEHVATLAGSTHDAELLDPALGLESLVWRLFHEEREVRVEQGAGLVRGCRCSVEHYREILARFPADDRAAMRDDEGLIRVDCAFCSRVFDIDL
jgi:molecular chaperone Hsp33